MGVFRFDQLHASLHKIKDMKAVTLVKTGEAKDAFKLLDHPVPEPSSGELLIKVEGFGLNYADVVARHGLYQPAPPLPSILGYEVVGKVEKVGPNSDQTLVGKRVLGFTRFGGYAEYAVANIKGTVEIPEDMPLGIATALGTQYVTAYYAVRESVRLHQGDRVLLHAAAGGVGTAIIQLCQLDGCEIFANAGSDEKCEFAKNNGATHVINYKKNDYAKVVRELTKEESPLDVAFNSVAGPTFKKDMKLLGSGGRMVLYGAADRSGKKWGMLSTMNMLRKMGIVIPIGLMMYSKGIIGVNMLGIADNKPDVLQRCMTSVIQLFKEEAIHPHVGGIFSVNDIAEAHSLLEKGSTMGKVSISW